ncbi:unnamed protein product [Diplocarpon coronariae]
MPGVRVPSAGDEKKMNITHTVCDEAQDELPRLRKHTSMAPVRVRDYISRRLSRASETSLSIHVAHSEDERPAVMWRQLEEKVADDALQRINKAAFKEEHRTQSNTNTKPSGNYAPLRSAQSKTHSRQSEGTMPRKAATLSSLVKDKLHKKYLPQSPEITDGYANDAEKEKGGARPKVDGDQMVKIQTLRKAMHEGKLERVIPPLSFQASIGTGRSRRAPPRPTHRPFLDSASPTRSGVSRGESGRTSHSLQEDHERGKGGEKERRSRGREKEIGGRIASFIGTSADLLDETRRELQGRFRPPFEHLGYPSISLARKRDSGNTERDADSDESFFCLGDGDAGKLNAQLGMAGRGGADSAAPARAGKCELCGLRRASGTKRPCAECEDGFLRLNERENGIMTGNWNGNGESGYSSSEYEDDVVVDSPSGEIKPTATLQEWKPLQITKHRPLNPSIDAWRPLQSIREAAPASPEEWKPLRIEKKSKVQASVPKQGSPSEFGDSDADSDDEHPAAVPPRAENDATFGLPSRKSSSRPSIADGAPSRQSPHRAAVEQSAHEDGESVAESGSRREAGVAGDGYAESQRAFRRWSSSFGDDVEEGLAEERGWSRVRRDS